MRVSTHSWQWIAWRNVSDPIRALSLALWPWFSCALLPLFAGDNAGLDRIHQPASSNRVELILAPSMQETNVSQRLAPGDRVSFRVMEDRGEPKLLTVADS